MKIGADPEFILSTTTGFRLIPAHDYFVPSGGVGCDGCSNIGELRPSPAENALALCANIKALILDLQKRYEKEMGKIRLLAGHYKCSSAIGGHIHISDFKTSEMGTMFSRNDIFTAVGRKLDLVMYPLSDIIDDLQERERRWGVGYGKGWRNEREGYWIEYRMPGSWLLSPATTFMNLWLAEAAVREWMDNPKKRKSWDKLQQVSEFSGQKCNTAKTGEKMDAIMEFATVAIGVENRRLFLKVAEKMFKSVPIDWDADMKEFWL